MAADRMAYSFENNWNITQIMLDTNRACGTLPHASRLTPHASRLNSLAPIFAYNLSQKPLSAFHWRRLFDFFHHVILIQGDFRNVR